MLLVDGHIVVQHGGHPADTYTGSSNVGESVHASDKPSARKPAATIASMTSGSLFTQVRDPSFIMRARCRSAANVKKFNRRKRYFSGGGDRA